ncbi:MAG: FAD-dependent oxidoreductase, partial [Bryobacteraceae bacterium]
AQDFTVVDAERVPSTGDAQRAVLRVHVPANPREIRCDVLIAGAGMGGVAAALAAADRGHSVCLTDETGWVGGQATSGGVSALDENRFIEFAGGTRSYYDFRNRIRQTYRDRYKLTASAARWENLNPGSCYVSPLCFEPKVGEAALCDMLRGKEIELLMRTKVLALERRGRRIVSALAWRFDAHEAVKIVPRFVLDATETGDLLPMAKVPYVVGSEAKSDTGEPDAGEEANHACVQSFTYPFAVERRDGEQHRIAKPPNYSTIVKRQGFTLRVNYPVESGWKGVVQYRMFGEDPPVPNNMSPGPFFPWRRLLAAANFTAGVPHDVALINWPRQDYAAESLLDRTPEQTADILQRAKQTSLAFLYWLQNDLPRDDGKGSGFPELMLRPDVMQTADGLSQYPYIRESRRIVAQGRVVEQDIVDRYQPGPRARWFPDSAGVGFYMVDIHPCGANERGQMRMPRPFQIPMAALLPRDSIENFLPAGKNLGVTHLTNGAFRLHPVEWNVGESAGMIASLQLENGSRPSFADVQRALARAGVSLVWFDDLGPDHPAFAAIQLAAIRGVYPLGGPDLHAAPDAPITRAEAASALAAYFGEHLTPAAAVAEALRRGWMASDHRNWFHGDLPFYWTDWREDKFPKPLPVLHAARTGPVRRSELALRLFGTGR